MIPRTLVPTSIRPADPAAENNGRPRRASTLLDARQLVPSDLPVVALDTRSTIPSHVPLDVLGNRLLVPRDLPPAPLETRSAIPAHLPLTVLDSRVVVPKGAKPPEIQPRAVAAARPRSAVLDPDVLTTGEVHLLAKPVEEETGWHLRDNWQAQVSSILFHGMLFLLVLLQPRLFPFQPHTPEQNELASRTLGLVYLPPGQPAPPPPVAPAPPRTSPQIRIDPRIFQQISPELEAPPKGPAEEPRVSQVPEGPKPQGQPELLEPRRPDEREQARLRTPKAPEEQATSPFALPGLSPGRALEESLRGAARGRASGPTSGTFGGPIPGGAGSGGTGQVYGAIELLTPTEGVDFSNYLARVLASVRRNWYAVIPESARLGEKGKVMLQFRIMRNGSVPSSEPILVRTSGRQPLDFAAMSSIRASNPFEPLPAAFSGPFIELRFIYLYNLPLDTP